MSTNQSDPSSPSSTRKARFESQGTSGRWLTPTTVGMAACVVLAAAFLYVVSSDARQPAGAVSGEDITMPAAQFDDGVARFFTYRSASGSTVRFFVMKSADGVIRAAFDACDTCYRERRGYRQSGDVMVCINCNQTFRSTDINVLKGGCNPAPLDRTVADGRVVLSAASLEAGAGYF